ncbi:MAG: threonylcarbamoyl-AMP synthase [Desulfurococcales archaeon ex4484_58]|nr:MAG: threonylcarbamoyl-AMP synthase [Desulfurococcales archaeon ex4484_58]
MVIVLTKIYRVDPDNIDLSVIEEAATILRKGGLVVFPTETVYGLGALITNRPAIKRIFEVKGRPMDNPLIVHVSDKERFLELVRDPPPKILELIDRFWPGPLTIVWWKKPIVPDEVTAGLPKVAVRAPAHPVALKLIEVAGEAIAAPSANRSGKPSPTKPEHVIEDLYGLVDLIIDSGETLHGIESTIIDFTVKPPKLLRPGALPIEVVEEILGEKIIVTDTARGIVESEKPEAPGMKYRHYAPETELLVVETDDYIGKLNLLVEKIRSIVVERKSRGLKIAILCSSETCNKYRDLDVIVIELGSREKIYTVTRRLFETLRRLDHIGVDLAIAEGFEEKGLGLTIMNRLRKAASQKIIKV